MAIWSGHALDAGKWRERIPAASGKLREVWRTERTFRHAVGFAILVVLFVFPVLATALLLAALAGLLGLLLQNAAKSSPLAWAVPWEAAQILLNRKARTNHAWNHRIQSLIREDESRTVTSGFADAEGVVVFADGVDKAQVQEFARAAWTELVQQADEKSVRGCKTIRFLLTVLICVAGTLALEAWRDIDLLSALLSMVISMVLAGALAPGAERLLGRFAETRAWQEEKAGNNIMHVRSLQVPQVFFFRGHSGFAVRRVTAAPIEENAVSQAASAQGQAELQTAAENESQPVSREPSVV